MPGFSAVDASPDPARLVRFLDEGAKGLTAIKHYIAVTHAQRAAGAPVLSLGCGAGHDLELLARFGVRGVGVDPSVTMLTASAQRSSAPLVRSPGEHLPFAGGAFAGCWIERVLMHVDEPSAIVAEAVRCTRPGGLLTVFEPDWSSLRIAGSGLPLDALSWPRQRAMGREVGALLREAGCAVLDRVEEHSWWTFEAFERITNLHDSLQRAVARGSITSTQADRWLGEQRRRAAEGRFSAEISKVLWVATTGAPRAAPEEAALRAVGPGAAPDLPGGEGGI